jgi:protein-S-isoprenylcysteine O-methyltransferase Ste14
MPAQIHLAEGTVMTTQMQDHPDVVIFPPLVMLGTLVLGVAVQWLWPLGAIAQLSAAWRFPLGAILILAGLGVTVSGRLALMRRGTNVNPLRPTTAVVTSGIYQWTRNPMYTGGAPVMLGLSLIFALDWLLIFIVPSYFILHFAVVRREERYLERKFGDAYRQYRMRVPRYVGWPKASRRVDVVPAK